MTKPRKITIKRTKGSEIKSKAKMKQIKDRLDRENGVKPKVRTKALTKARKIKKVA